MKKTLLLLSITIMILYANSGQEIYQNKCSMCHADKGMMSMQERESMITKMLTASTEEKVALKQKMMQKFKKSKMKAPAMMMVSLRLKSKLKTKKEFITFVNDYIQNPSKEKGFCMPRAYSKFGTMPPIGKSMSEEERIAVATWLYTNYKGSWYKSGEAKECESRNKKFQKKLKCGAASHDPHSAVKIPTH